MKTQTTHSSLALTTTSSSHNTQHVHSSASRCISRLLTLGVLTFGMTFVSQLQADTVELDSRYILGRLPNWSVKLFRYKNGRQELGRPEPGGDRGSFDELGGCRFKSPTGAEFDVIHYSLQGKGRGDAFAKNGDLFKLTNTSWWQVETSVRSGAEIVSYRHLERDKNANNLHSRHDRIYIRGKMRITRIEAKFSSWDVPTIDYDVMQLARAVADGAVEQLSASQSAARSDATSSGVNQNSSTLPNGAAATTSQSATRLPKATRRGTGASAIYKNSMGMRFVALPGTHSLICVHETRSRDFAIFANTSAFQKLERGDYPDAWRLGLAKGVPVGRGVNEAAEDSNHPVVWVSKTDAEAFCAWLTQRERKLGTITSRQHYRLPTHAEWAGAALNQGTGEYTSEFPAEFRNPAASNRDAPEDGFKTTAPVCSFAANANGLFDTMGNVWEWAADTPKSKGDEVLHGGSFWARYMLGGPYELVARRNEFGMPLEMFPDVGFRCVLDNGQ